MSVGRTGERGAALLIVMVAVAVLTALAANLAYDARVSLQIAANARNELQATYLAKSGVAFSRLVLDFQRELEAAMPNTAGQPGMPSIPRPQLWKLAPVGSEIADGLFGGAYRTRPESAVAPAAAGGAPAGHPQTGAAPGSPAAGTFQVSIDDEGRKVNFQLDSLPSSKLLGPQVQAIWQIVCDPRWDPLFDREDANGLKISRTDLLVYLRDWVDDEAPQTSSALAASFAPNGCAMATPLNPFEPGFGDENFPYERGEDRYRTKNARMDSLDELSLVAGIGDAFLAAFRDQITVYLSRDEPPNVNTTNPLELRLRAQMLADPPENPKVNDPVFLEQLMKLMLEKTQLGVFFISPAEFGQVVQQAGLTINDAALKGFTDRSSVFRLRSVGRAGDVTKTLDVIVRMDKPQGAVVVVTPGKILHWREE